MIIYVYLYIIYVYICNLTVSQSFYIIPLFMIRLDNSQRFMEWLEDHSLTKQLKCGTFVVFT